MRILRVVNSSDAGGIFACEIQFIEELKKRDVIIDAVIVGDGDKTEEYKKICNLTYSVPALDFNYSGSPLKIVSAIAKNINLSSKYVEDLKKQIPSDINYDVIMYQKTIYIHLVGNLAKSLNAKAMWHLPCIIRTNFGKLYYSYFCKKYEIIQVANSLYTKTTLGKQCKYVVYPGYDPKRIQKGASTFRKMLVLDSNVPVYGIAARMHEYKAQDIVVEAFVKSNIPSVGGHLLVAGGPLDSDYAQEVQGKAGALLNKQVHFLGEIKDMSEFYSSVNIIINGRRNVEPFGISIAEAIGAGKPVIAYKLGGPSEMIVDGANGWLVDNPTTQSYKDAFNLSIENKNKWLKMGEFAKESSHKFTVEENVNTLMHIINNSKN